MRHGDEFSKVQRQAEALLRELNITELPVDPYKIAKRLDIELKHMPSNNGGVSGMLVRFGNEFLIAYPTHLENEGFKRFSVGHELGHYWLPGHPDAVIDTTGMHLSRAGFVADDRYELEADHFAAALLMPRQPFTQALRKLPPGLRGIETLRTLCVTSLESTAIRYSQCSPDPVAIIRSRGTKMDYCFMSDALRRMRGLTWIKKNTPVPSGTATADLLGNPGQIRLGGRKTNKSNMRDWFNSDRQEILEEVVGLGRYGRVLTVLTGMRFLDEYDDGDHDEA